MSTESHTPKPFALALRDIAGRLRRRRAGRWAVGGLFAGSLCGACLALVQAIPALREATFTLTHLALLIWMCALVLGPALISALVAFLLPMPDQTCAEWADFWSGRGDQVRSALNDRSAFAEQIRAQASSAIADLHRVQIPWRGGALSVAALILLAIAGVGTVLRMLQPPPVPEHLRDVTASEILLAEITSLPSLAGAAQALGGLQSVQDLAQGLAGDALAAGMESAMAEAQELAAELEQGGLSAHQAMARAESVQQALNNALPLAEGLNLQELLSAENANAGLGMLSELANGLGDNIDPAALGGLMQQLQGDGAGAEWARGLLEQQLGADALKGQGADAERALREGLAGSDTLQTLLQHAQRPEALQSLLQAQESLGQWTELVKQHAQAQTNGDSARAQASARQLQEFRALSEAESAQVQKARAEAEVNARGGAGSAQGEGGAGSGTGSGGAAAGGDGQPETSSTTTSPASVRVEATGRELQLRTVDTRRRVDQVPLHLREGLKRYREAPGE